jgi:hypothetical protein
VAKSNAIAVPILKIGCVPEWRMGLEHVHRDYSISPVMQSRQVSCCRVGALRCCETRQWNHDEWVALALQRVAGGVVVVMCEVQEKNGIESMKPGDVSQYVPIIIRSRTTTVKKL